MMQPGRFGGFGNGEQDRDVRDGGVDTGVETESRIDVGWCLRGNGGGSLSFIVGHVLWLYFWAVRVGLVAIVNFVSDFHVLNQ